MVGQLGKLFQEGFEGLKVIKLASDDFSITVPSILTNSVILINTICSISFKCYFNFQNFPSNIIKEDFPQSGRYFERC